MISNSLSLFMSFIINKMKRGNIMMKKTTSQDVIKIVWKACDTFRGTMDSSKYKDYILTMLFVKYVSDFYKEK